jgi:hypothetical protein
MDLEKGETTMPVRILRFVTLVLVALAMGLEFAHLLELPAKMRYDAQLYREVQHTLYYYFAVIGDPSSSARSSRRVRWPSWRAGVKPLSGSPQSGRASWRRRWRRGSPSSPPRTPRWPPAWATGALPPDWTHVRALWEYGHAAGAALLIVGFCALLLSVLRGTPTENPPEAKSLERFATARAGRRNPGDSR